MFLVAVQQGAGAGAGAGAAEERIYLYVSDNISCDTGIIFA